MVTGTMVEIGGLLIVTAATLQVLIVLRSMRLRRALAAKPPSGDVIVRSAGVQDIEPLSWLGKRRFQVAMRAYETANRQVCSYYLVPLDKRPIPSFRPGQFLTFEVADPRSGASRHAVLLAVRQPERTGLLQGVGEEN